MPELRTYNLFISHRWNYDNQYNDLKTLLNNANNFSYKDYSVPNTEPLDVNSKRELCKKIEDRIKLASVLIVLGGMYVNYSGVIPDEIKIAKLYNKPIIGVKPFGNLLMPTIVSNNATEIVNWNTNSIIEAIRKYAI